MEAGNLIVGITGGIGSGKSVVSRMLRLQGYTVYDCDSRAAALMDASEELRVAIARVIGEECVSECGYDRKAIARHVFEDEEKRAWLNSEVHAMVRSDIELEAEKMCKDGILFVESAIMKVSGLDKMCSCILMVDAPDDVRLKRAMGRDNADEDAIRRRMAVQKNEYEDLDADLIRIVNDGDESLLLQLASAIQSMK